MIMRVVSALLLKLVLVASLSAFAQSTDNSLRLPHPSGAYGVGRVGYDWVDQSRAEAFAKDPSARREIMVYVWYPIDLGSGNLVRADYLPHADAIAKFEESSPTGGLEGLGHFVAAHFLPSGCNRHIRASIDCGNEALSSSHICSWLQCALHDVHHPHSRLGELWLYHRLH
jgi:hypothetical protein